MSDDDGDDHQHQDDTSTHEAFILRVPLTTLQSASTIHLPKSLLSSNRAKPESNCRATVNDGEGMPDIPQPVSLIDDGLVTTIAKFSGDLRDQKNREVGLSNHTCPLVRKRLLLEPPSQLKALGKKARASLESERANRREIVRIEDSDVNKKAKSPSLNLFKKAKLSIPKRKKTKQGSTPKSAPSQKRQKSNDPQLDSWYPDISRIPTCPKDAQSQTVQLHGLPIMARAENIRRFFSGLEIERIFILPHCEHAIPSLDSFSHEDGSRPSIPRFDNTTRIFVKFKSSPVAALAAERSLETISIPEQSDDSITKARICVSNVEKKVASHFLKTMATDLPNGERIDPIANRADDIWHPSVGDILWSYARRELNLDANSNARVVGSAVLLLNLKDMESKSSFNSYKYLAAYFNRLAKLCEELESNNMLACFAEATRQEQRASLEGRISATIQLTKSTINILETEMNSVEAALYRMRMAIQNCADSI